MNEWNNDAFMNGEVAYKRVFKLNKCSVSLNA